MARVEAILAVGLAISLAGCALTGKPPAPAPVVAPQPQPPTAAAKPPSPPPEPLSVPQTQVQLPPPQPVNLEALAAAPPPKPVEPETAPKTVRRPAAAPTGSTTARTDTATVAPATTAAAPTEPERPPIGEIVPADERKRYQDSADQRKREIRFLLQQAKGRRLNAEQNKTVKRINNFLAQSDDAEKRGDMRQADALAERGVVLARELAGGK